MELRRERVTVKNSLVVSICTYANYSRGNEKLNAYIILLLLIKSELDNN